MESCKLCFPLSHVQRPFMIHSLCPWLPVFSTDICRGLELYKEALLLHDKLTAYYLTMQAVPALR